MSHHFPTGLLELLTKPHRPWSLVAVDFIPNLPESIGMDEKMQCSLCEMQYMCGYVPRDPSVTIVFHQEHPD